MFPNHIAQLAKLLFYIYILIFNLFGGSRVLPKCLLKTIINIYGCTSFYQQWNSDYVDLPSSN
jgi:hypothetical protein